MTKAFIATRILESTGIPASSSLRAAGDLIDAIKSELKTRGKFTLPGFGTFTVQKTKARKAVDPRNGQPVKVEAGKTVRFKPSPTLRMKV
ncbi:MAG: HU family DNA-binding protein [Acidiphilium sp.]|nr:HU family DNA-binding protein [Acidiphilium sp.]MDD4937091.1 HU family DNA-binding protein [Acidiphilium sp.]